MDARAEDPYQWQQKKMFTDPLAAVAESLINSTSHLWLEAGVRQGSAVKILQEHRWHHYTTQVYQYHNEDNQFGQSNCTHLLTPWCRVLPEKLTGLQLVK